MKAIRYIVFIALLTLPLCICACSRQSFSEQETAYSEAFRDGKYERANTLATRLLATSEREFSASSPQYATALNKLGLTELQLGRLSAAEQHHEMALRTYEALYSRQHESVARSLSYLSQVYFAQGRIDWAGETARQALNIYIEIFGPDHFLTASQMNSLALIYQHQGKNVQARLLFNRALRGLRYNMDPSNPSIAAVSNNLEKINQLMSTVPPDKPSH